MTAERAGGAQFLRLEGTIMFTTKPETGEKITKLGGGLGDAKTPYRSKNSG
jgi:hypothetical protein